MPSGASTYTLYYVCISHESAKVRISRTSQNPLFLSIINRIRPAVFSSSTSTSYSSITKPIVTIVAFCTYNLNPNLARDTFPKASATKYILFNHWRADSTYSAHMYVFIQFWEGVHCHAGTTDCVDRVIFGGWWHFWFWIDVKSLLVSVYLRVGCVFWKCMWDGLIRVLWKLCIIWCSFRDWYLGIINVLVRLMRKMYKLIQSPPLRSQLLDLCFDEWFFLILSSVYDILAYLIEVRSCLSGEKKLGYLPTYLIRGTTRLETMRW